MTEAAVGAPTPDRRFSRSRRRAVAARSLRSGRARRPAVGGRRACGGVGEPARFHGARVPASASASASASAFAPASASACARRPRMTRHSACHSSVLANVRAGGPRPRTRRCASGRPGGRGRRSRVRGRCPARRRVRPTNGRGSTRRGRSRTDGCSDRPPSARVPAPAGRPPAAGRHGHRAGDGPRGGSFRTLEALGAPSGQRPPVPGRRAASARTAHTRCAARESAFSGTNLPPARRPLSFHRPGADPAAPRPRRRTVRSAGAGVRPPAAASVGRVGRAARLPPPKGRATAGERARNLDGGGARGASGAVDGRTGRSRMLPIEPSAPPRARMSVPTDSVSVETRSRGRKDVRRRHR